MTICISVRVGDAMVFVADSATSIQATGADGRSFISNVYMGGDKLFNLYRGLPIMAMTCGMGHINGRTISSLAKELRARMMSSDRAWRVDPTNYTIAEIAEKARRFFWEERYLAQRPLPPPPHSFELWIGGYDAGAEIHDLWKLMIDSGTVSLERVGTQGEIGVYAAGQPQPIFRLLLGIDPQAIEILKSARIDPAAADGVVDLLRSKLFVALVHPAMPVANAIDLARYLATVTKGYFRFLPGADIVGGDLDIAVVTRHEGFKWVERKHYYPAHLNNREIDHVGAAHHPAANASRSVPVPEPTSVRLSRGRELNPVCRPKRPSKAR